MKKLLFALIALCMSISANAQFYGDSSIHYYVEAGKDAKSGQVYCVIFNGKQMFRASMPIRSVFLEKYKNGTWVNFIKYNFEHNSDYSYDSEWSTSVRTTYRYGAWRYAFKNDKSEYKVFVVNPYGEVSQRGVYEEIPESELLPKTPNKDFLYE